MLSLAKAAKDYYLRKLGEISPGEDYYLRGGTATGIWLGSGAKDLGLEGSVSAEGLMRLFDGQHPDTGEQLGRSLRKDGVAAWDVTFSADKSVSLLWALSDDQTRQQVLEAFEEATVSALGYLESVASSTRGASKTPVLDDNGDPVLNENGTPRFQVETWPIQTSGYVAASFTEFTSRADDPQIHTHVVVANKVKGVDGVWRTVDGRLLYRYQLAAGYLHEAVLRRELTGRLGVRWQPVGNGMADIAGFTRSQIEAFSRRRHQLEEWRQDQGLPDTAAARQVAVLATREPKRDHPLADLEAEWQQRAVEVGLTPDQITQLMSGNRHVTPADPTSLFERLASPAGLTERASTFGRADVVKEIAGALPDGGTREEIESLAETFLATREVVPLLPTPNTERIQEQEDPEVDIACDRAGELTGAEATGRPMRHRDGSLFPGIRHERRFTTTELLVTEQRIIDQAISGVDAGRWTAPDRLVEARLRRYPHLTDGQRDMVRYFATSGNGIDIGIGPAGTGKTAVMEVISQLATLTDAPILGGALAGRTAAGLQEATGIPSTTLTRLVGESRNQGLPHRTIVVVDEAGMVGTRQLAAVADLVEQAEGKLILIGDDRQLPEIDAGGLFKALTNRLPAVELTDNIRQRDQWEQAALTQLRDGSVDQAVDMYQQHRRLIVGQSRDDTMGRAVTDWYRHVTATGDLTSGLLIAYDNDTVTELNEEARTHIAASNRLDGPALEIEERTFQAGDRILCRKNQTRLGVLNGDLATVVSVDQKRKSLTVRLDRDPEPRNLPVWYLDQDVDYGYALTGHKAQGVTTGRTFVIVDGTTDRQWAYVAMSRGRQTNTLYLANPEPADQQCTHLTHQGHHDPLDRLTAALNRGSTQTAAIDQAALTKSDDIDLLGPPPPSTDVAARIAWQIAKRRIQRDETERQTPSPGLAAGR